MAEKDSITTKQKGIHWADPEVQKVIAGLRAIRAIGDLLCMAAYAVKKNAGELHESTLAEIGAHLEDLTTEALVILNYESRKPQAAAPGGE